ncbi:MAG: hypothetical protein F6K10_13570 [Moorea sp. SIO2B7]|nr:hypothetical protein [Moorena sp. SIO2B7]
MNKLGKITFGTTSIIAICLTTLVVQAGGVDNFKLRYFHLKSYLHNQEK